MSRSVCDGCGRPEKVCLCSHLIHYELPFRLVIWQDPDEAKHPLSTAPLLERSIKGCELKVGDQFTFEEVFAVPADAGVALLYPSDECSTEADAQAIHTVLVLDGTWRKVRRLTLLNPWVLSLPRVSLSPDRPSEYLRTSQVEGGVSTLEAVLMMAHQCAPEGNYLEGIGVLQRMAELQEQMRRR